MTGKKSLVWIIIIILCVNLSTALNDTAIYQSQYLVVDTDFATTLQIEPSGPRPVIEELTASIAFFPIATEEQTVSVASYSHQKPRAH